MGREHRPAGLGQESLDRVISAFIRSRGATSEVELLAQEIADRFVGLPAEGLLPLRRLFVGRTMTDRRARVVKLIDEALREVSFEV